MANSNRRIKKTTKKKSPNFEINNLTRAILIITAIILSLCFLTTKMGQVGLFINNIFYLILGNAVVVLPILMVFITINSYLNSIETSDILLIISAIAILILSSIFLDSISALPGIYKNRFAFGIDPWIVGINGGMLGAYINSILLNLFGSLGLTIIVIILTSISLVVFFNLDYQEMGTNIAIGFENLSAKSKELADSAKEKSIERKNNKETKAIDEQRSKREKIKINHPSLMDSDQAFAEDNRKKSVKFQIENDDKKEEDPYIFDQSEFDSNVEPEKISAVTETDKLEIQKEIEGKEDSTPVYEYPPISLLNRKRKTDKIDKDEIYENSRIIEETMENFGIDAKVERVNSGPTVTCYELVPASNVRLSRIVGLADNLSFSLASPDIRIEAPIPGKTAVGIEVPNREKSMVTLEEVINSKAFEENKSDLPLVLGKDTDGGIVISAIDEMPHLLIAGATGSGKSVCVNSIIISLLYKTSPKDLRLILIDPKIVELGIYNDIPHLLIPVVTEPKKAASTLAWAVEEMERRYKTFAENFVKDIRGYNEKFAGTDQKLAKIVIIIDELADLMMVASNEVEDYIQRLTQMARAAGMHLIIATQRPSVDVITGIIKANVPSRISFAVSSQVDSRTILGFAGAEKLLGKGDMLFHPSFYSKPKRIQGAFVSAKEVDRVVEFFKNREYDVDISEEIIEEIQNVSDTKKLDADPLFMDALKLVLYDEQASISYLQRKLSIGYSRAARIVDTMEEQGFVGPSKGSKPRDIYITEEEYLKMLGEDID
ncbi:MAG: DNA translocase FtsK [Tissierellia bacterium]|nr:DNA translocase FtsK [Tissierellia bacterium]